MSHLVNKRTLWFPEPETADATGLLCIGGDLSPDRLLLAYSKGIFPWYMAGGWVHWFCPEKRMILIPAEVKISHSMNQVFKRNTFRITVDTCFKEVITACGEVERKNQEGTWVNDEFVKAFCCLHEMGYAHSFETWRGDELVGGLYGVSLGKSFFGESMFSKAANASKAAFITMAKKLSESHFDLIDCQLYTPHLESLGAKEISRKMFLKKLKSTLRHEVILGKWTHLF
jgi:leucyl/phenylalanyl-tRNA---protein transferase